MDKNKHTLAAECIRQCLIGVYPDLPQTGADEKLIRIARFGDTAASFSGSGQARDGKQKTGGELVPAMSIFNRLNKCTDTKMYRPGPITEAVRYPQDNAEPDGEAKAELISLLTEASDTELLTEASDTELLMSRIEERFSYSAISEKDVSVYDHIKMAAAAAVCAYEYENECGEPSDPLNDEIFVVCHVDISGIQSFIYTITSKEALKNLRVRSFYLDMLLEITGSELVKRAGLLKANILYSGGGNVYLLLPNTESAIDKVNKAMKELNGWFLENFASALYADHGMSACSANAFRDVPKGSYGRIFSTLHDALSARKAARYGAEEIRQLNFRQGFDHSRECAVCRNSFGKLVRMDGRDVCEHCKSFAEFSRQLLKEKIFSISLVKHEPCLSLPFGQYLVSGKCSDAVGCYRKNSFDITEPDTSRLLLGDYASDNDFESLAKASRGVKRLAVLRADVDSLGQAFISGFGDNASVSSTAAFSRSMSMFFKYHINTLLNEPYYRLPGGNETDDKRRMAVVYAGGDDLFVVGAWDEVIGFAIDLRNEFAKFTQNTLTLSAGIGMYDHKFPVSAMAKLTGELEENSKKYTLGEGENAKTKNAVSLFNDENVYSWDEFENKVLREKLVLLNDYFKDNDEHGSSLMYNMLQLIRENSEAEDKNTTESDRTDENKKKSKFDRLNIARFAYLLGRLRPAASAKAEKKAKYKEFSSKLYDWVSNESGEDRRQLVTAIYIYVYLNRKDDDNEG